MAGLDLAGGLVVGIGSAELEGGTSPVLGQQKYDWVTTIQNYHRTNGFWNRLNANGAEESIRIGFRLDPLLEIMNVLLIDPWEMQCQ